MQEREEAHEQARVFSVVGQDLPIKGVGGEKGDVGPAGGQTY